MGLASCLLSLLLHISLILLTVFAPWPGTDMRLDLDQPVYEVEVVRLPEQKEAVNVPRSDTSDREQTVKKKQPAKQARTPPKEQPKAAPAPAQKSEAVKIAQEDKKPQATRAPQKKRESQPQESPEPRSREEVQTPESVMQQALQDASEQADKEDESDEDVLGQELAQLRQEAVEQGLDLENLGRTSSRKGAEGVYGALIRERIRSNWRFPDMGREDDLQATVKISINDQGRITDHSLVQSSGDSQFDSSVLRAIDRTGNLQAPPSQELQSIQITFHLQDMSP
ncbi:MAG: cell envelope integrity protein TolA [Desulfovermiculus sp.]